MQYPPTSGKVIIDTSHGELEVELWCKEVPKGCRNFIALCLESYYDNCIFHRLIPNFMIQGGDPTGTGEGGKSIYGQPFQDEFHSRLTFSTRGILAYSNSGPNSNESQFFFTFDTCNWLDKKHTIFGRVVGNTIYNLMSMNSVDTDSNDVPLDKIFIKSTQVIIDPFNITVKLKEVQEAPLIVEQKQIKKLQPQKKQKNTCVLSFGDDEEEQDEGGKIINSHDILNDPKLKKEVAITQEELKQKQLQKENENRKINDLKNAIQNPTSKTQDLIQKKIQLNRITNDAHLEDEDKALLNYKIQRNAQGEIEYIFNDDLEEDDEESDIEDEELKKIRQQQQEEYEKLKADVLSFKEMKFGSNNPLIKDMLVQDKKLLSTVEARRAKFLENQKAKIKDEKLEEKIQRYREKLNSEDIRTNKYHWLNHKLKFHIDSANAYNQDENKSKVQDFQAGHLVEREYQNQKQRNNLDLLLKLSEQGEQE